MKKSNTKKIMLTVIGLLIVCIYLMPIYWMIISSLKTNSEIFAAVPTFFPHHPTLDSYRTLFSEQNNFQQYIWNSLIISIATTIFTVILCTPAAYGLARARIKGVTLLIGFVLVIQMFPSSMLSLPLFTLFSKFHLTDSYVGVILANMTISMPFCIAVLRTFFLSLPKELEAAAQVDGCSTWGTFFRIILPLSKTGIMTCAAFSFVFGWGEFMYSLILLNDSRMWPITVGMRQFDGQYGTQWGALMAAATVCSLPVILIFLIAQKYIVSGVTAGSVKG